MVEPVTAPATPLDGTRWVLAELDGETVPPAEDERAPHLVFDAAESRVSGSGGCNLVTGSFELTGDGLWFGPLVSTRMACPEALMRREAAFLRALAAVTRSNHRNRFLIAC